MNGYILAMNSIFDGLNPFSRIKIRGYKIGRAYGTVSFIKYRRHDRFCNRGFQSTKNKKCPFPQSRNRHFFKINIKS